jgi:hypothetical protein
MVQVKDLVTVHSIQRGKIMSEYGPPMSYIKLKEYDNPINEKIWEYMEEIHKEIYKTCMLTPNQLGIEPKTSKEAEVNNEYVCYTTTDKKN